MSREKEFVQNTVILSIGKFLPQITSFITIPILTAYLSKTEYGFYDLIATLVMLLIPVATLQIQSAAFRFLIESRSDLSQTKIIVSNIFVVTIPISLVVSFIAPFFFFETSIIIKISIGTYLFLDTVQLTLGQIVRGLGFNKIFSIGSIILSIVNMIGIVIGVYAYKAGLIGVLVSLIISQLVVVLYYSSKINLVKYLNISLRSKEKIKELLAYSWPMIPNNLSTWVLKLSDRLVITAFLGIEANAVYAVANKIPNLLSIAQSVMVMAWQENASIAIKDNNAREYFSKMFDQLFAFMIGSCAVIISFTPVLFRLLIKGDYGQAYYQIPILILGMFFFCMAAFQGGIYIAHKKTKSVGFTTMIAAFINLLVDLLLIKWIGITAGSVSTLVAYLFLYLYRMFDVKRFQEIDYKIVKQIVLLITIILMLFICLMNNLYLNILNGLWGAAFFVVLNRKMITSFVNIVKKKVF